MKKFVIFLVCAALLLSASGIILYNVIKGNSQKGITTTPTATLLSPIISQAPSAVPTEVVTDDTQQSTLVSFTGDCTLASQHGTWSNANSFIKIIGTNYSYPFSKVKSVLEQDDMTLVNFEGVLTNYNVPVSKEYNFRASPEKVNILTSGSVEAVNLANNHSMDYGQQGYDDTIAALKSKEIVYAGHGEVTTYTTTSGIKIGMVGYKFIKSSSTFASNVQKLRDQGCDIIIFSMHWGTEGSYGTTAEQESMAKAAIDAGADIVVGHHPHVLEKIATYKGKYILYSLGNFVFGGNTNPSDKDTAIVQATFTTVGGEVTATKLKVIPCSLSGVTTSNNYQPIILKDTSEAAKSVYKKLNWAASKN